jgi:hypothetical protein
MEISKISFKSEDYLDNKEKYWKVKHEKNLKENINTLLK